MIIQYSNINKVATMQNCRSFRGLASVLVVVVIVIVISSHHPSHSPYRRDPIDSPVIVVGLVGVERAAPADALVEHENLEALARSCRFKRGRQSTAFRGSSSTGVRQFTVGFDAPW
jgi:hypothetical protein